MVCVGRMVSGSEVGELTVRENNSEFYAFGNSVNQKLALTKWATFPN